MYAVIKSGGKQFKVKVGQILQVEKQEIEPGAEMQFSEVLLYENDGNILIGSPSLDNVQVSGSVVRHGRHKKISIIKFKRRKHHMKRAGHRQYFTEIKISDIKLN